jgi:hypothetical protein
MDRDFTRLMSALSGKVPLRQSLTNSSAVFHYMGIHHQ